MDRQNFYIKIARQCPDAQINVKIITEDAADRLKRVELWHVAEPSLRE